MYERPAVSQSLAHHEFVFARVFGHHDNERARHVWTWWNNVERTLGEGGREEKDEMKTK
jgi:hypothetical protein